MPVAAARPGLPTPARFDTPEQLMPQYRCSPADGRLLEQMRHYLRAAEKPARKPLLDAFAAASFPRTFDRLAVVAYQRGRKRLLVVRRRRGEDVLAQVLDAMRAHGRHNEFDWGDAACRIQLDFISAPTPTDIHRIGLEAQGEDHFEIGLEGLRYSLDGRSHYFLPGDAYRRSINGMRQLRRWLANSLQRDDLQGVEFERITSESYVSYESDWLRLFRGHPVNGPLSSEQLLRATHLAIAHVRGQQREDGSFLYYYDAARDSRRDHEHPGRDPDSNPYYNILRHGGGILTYLYYIRLFDERELLPSVRRGIDFLLAQARTYTTPVGEEAAYIYYNRKAKLGGSGIALYALSEYQRQTGDERYAEWAHRLARHLLEQVTPSGEFIYYHIYLDTPVTREDNDRYFSFYYPGEALCGLAGYYKHVCREPEVRAAIEAKVFKALRFLIVDRPILRAEHYAALPSDAWLMMAINELWDEERFRVDLFKEFVFHDGDAMVRQMYKVDDAPYPDYAGAFFYRFGDFPYADGARCEGLQGAYELACKVGDKDRIETYCQALRLAAWATLQLVNTPESLYFARNPELALGGIRFKHTRQWFRIDTIQHVAGFYLKAMLNGRCFGPELGAETGPANS